MNIIEKLKKRTFIRNEDIACLIGASVRSIDRWEKGEKPSPLAEKALISLYKDLEQAGKDNPSP